MADNDSDNIQYGSENKCQTCKNIANFIPYMICTLICSPFLCIYTCIHGPIELDLTKFRYC